jgi:hypothetical protein
MTTKIIVPDSPVKLYPSRLSIEDLRQLLVNIWSEFDRDWVTKSVNFKGKKYLDGGLELEIEYLSFKSKKLQTKYNLSIRPDWEIGDFFKTLEINVPSRRRFNNIFEKENKGLRSKLQEVVSKTMNGLGIQKYSLVSPALKDGEWIVFLQPILFSNKRNFEDDLQ